VAQQFVRVQLLFGDESPENGDKTAIDTLVTKLRPVFSTWVRP
jgi:hypothetical protein